MNDVSWKDAWTGGQYSVVRFAAGALMTCFLLVTAFDPDGISWFSAALAVAAAMFTAGHGGRLLTVTFATLVPFGTGDWGDSTAGAIAGAWLFLHLGLPAAPFGSLAARGRQDPRGTWKMPGWYPASCMALFVLTRFGYGMQEMMDGKTVLAAAFVVPGVLAVARPTALLGWSLSFAVEVGLAAAGDGSFSSAFLMHLIAFQPAWLPRSENSDVGTMFYDGTCALCHGVVRFLVAEDLEPARFRLSPIGGASWLARVPERVRVTRPDSIVVLRGSDVLLRSAAVLAILEELGGVWSLLAIVVGVFPPGLLDRLYDVVAARRYAWFGRKTEACPLMTPVQKLRFDP